MTASYPFPMYSGIFEPKHYKQIGSALWFFAWCISSTTKEAVDEEGITWGQVLGKKPLKIPELAEPFGVDEKTVRRWIKTLEEHGYIRVSRAPYGVIIEVKNSKRRLDKNVRTYEPRSDKFVHSQPERSGKNVQSVQTDRTDMSTLPDKNVHSNKDIIQDIYIADVDDDIRDQKQEIARRVEQHFLKRRGKGFAVSPTDYQEIMKLVSSGMPLPVIIAGIDRAFDEYRPKHRYDEIRTFSYCVPICYDEWERDKASSVTAVVPPASVALGTRRNSKVQQQLDELDRFIAEEEKRRGKNRDRPPLQENQAVLPSL
jgi:DNA-binding MarR family transcriptional regulator